MAAQPILFVTPEEYLALERAATFKSEYLSGQMYAMSGASREHNVIAFNIGGLIYAALKGKPCQGFNSDMRVAVSGRPAFFYPDVTIVCGDPQFTDTQGDTLANPLVLIEIASPSTANFDRTVKRGKYFQIPSVREVVLVSQDRSLAIDTEDVKAQSPEDFARAIVKPFLGQLSIHAYEGVYSMDRPDLAACRRNLLADLLDSSTMVE